MKKLGRDGRTVTKLELVRRWTANHLGKITHERRVSAIARRLVDQTSHFHNLDRSDLLLLKFACYLHDVGRCVNEKDHPGIGAEMILEDAHLPLKNRRRRALAYLTLYHRGAVPPEGKDVMLRRSDDAEKLRLMLAFLRAADGLDCRSLPAPRLSIRYRNRRLRIVCRLSEDSPKARRVFARRKKFRLLEEILGLRIQVAIIANRRLRLAA
jgi:exopolyphosphatase / guanosine-5'-triphosphate,3'-diphosphate pyrophosphatase